MALTTAERQARFRARKRAAGLQQKEIWVDPKADEKKRQQEAYQAEIAKQERKEFRDAEKTKYINRGRIDGIVSVALMLIKKERPDLVKEILKAFYIDRQRCADAVLDKMEMDAISLYLD